MMIKEVELYPVSYKSSMNAENLSKTFRRGELSYPLIPSIWSKLVGKLIDCPMCDRKAVIVPYGIELPIKRLSDIPCHCAISLNTGVIICHWCYCTDECCDEKNQYYPSAYGSVFHSWMNDVNRDVYEGVVKIMKKSYRIGEGG